MTGTGQAGPDVLRQWLERHRALLEAGGGPLWQQCEHLYRAWAGFAEAFAGAHAARHGEPDASPFDPAGWLRPEGGGGMADLLRWLEGPVLPGALGQPAEAVRGTREWLAYLAAVEQMKAVLAEGWLAAFQSFLARAAEDAPPAGTPHPAAEGPEDAAPREDPAEGWARLHAIWRDAMAGELAAMHRRPAFLAASRDLLRAETDLRRSLRARVETVAEELGLPTRAELDDMHVQLHALGREMRRMRARARAAPDHGRG